VLPPLHDTDFYLAPEQVGVLGTTLTVALVGIIGLPMLLATALVRRRDALLRAREALAAEAGADTRVLRPGKTVVHGEVLGDAQLPCVSIRIRQSGRNYTVKNGTRHKWTETGRVVEARPFPLKLATGATVQVEPDQGVLLVDWLGTEARPGTTERIRVAELRPPTRVYVEGELIPPPRTDAYRGGDATFALRPRRDAPMLISVEPLEARHLARARRHGQWAIGLLVAVVFANVVLFGSFWRGSVMGSVQMADVAKLSTWKTTNKGRTTIHYGVLPSFGPQTTARQVTEVSAPAYQEASYAITEGGTAQLPFVVIQGSETRWVGLRPTIHVFVLVVSWMAALILPFAYLLWVRHHRPWYERKKVVDDGAGPLGASDQLE
jgi:hypothetical protein